MPRLSGCVGRQRAEPLQCQHGRDAGWLDEVAECRHRIAEDDAAAAVDDRLLRLRDQRQRRVQRGIDRRRRIGSIRARHVRRQTARHRRPARPWAGRSAPGPGGLDGRCGTLRAPCRGSSSTRRGRKLCLTIGMVMPNTSSSWNASVPISVVGDLAGDAHHRHRVQHRVGDAGDQVRRARSGGRHAHADAAAGARIAVGRECRALLVADQHVAAGLEPVQRVVERHDRAARDSRTACRRLRRPAPAPASARLWRGAAAAVAFITRPRSCGRGARVGGGLPAAACGATSPATSCWRAGFLPTASIGWSRSACLQRLVVRRAGGVLGDPLAREGAVLDLGQHLLHLRAGVGVDDARAAASVRRTARSRR